MKKIIVENLVGRGLTGVVTKEGKQYDMYRDFARAAGYPESVYNDVSAVDGEKVNILAKGNHGGDYATIYVVENMDGEKYLIDAEGVEIVGKPELGVIEKMQAELAELKSKVAALESTKVGKVADFRKCKGETVLPNINCRHFVKFKSPQQIRDEIVAKAKADVAELEYEARPNLLRTKFFVNRDKRAVVCLLERFDLGFIHSKGIAKADPSDCFNVHIGKAIALRRAMGLEVPAEYYNAPAPTEVRVGDVVEFTSRRGEVKRRTIKRISYGRAYTEQGNYVHLDNGVRHGGKATNPKTIDDSRE